MNQTRIITLLLIFILVSVTVTAQNLSRIDSTENGFTSVNEMPDSMQITSITNFETIEEYAYTETPIDINDYLDKEELKINQAPIQMKGSPVIGLRTNLAYWAVLIPNIGLEWHIKPRVSVQANVAWTHLKSGDQMKQYRLYNLSGEARYYMGKERKGYLGLGFNTGQFNFKKKEGEVGRQGDMQFGAGLTGGYVLELNKNFNLDFGLGLGYMKLKYDRYTRDNGKFIRLEGDLNKNYFGPTQVTIGLVWKIKQVML